MSSPQPQPPADPAALLSRLRARQAARGHRAAVVLTGSEAWTLAAARQALGEVGQDQARLWLGAGAPAGVPGITAAQTGRMLGREVDLVVFNAWSGFDPDAFGAIAGTLRAGGALLLLAPPLERWADYPDPDYARITVAGCDPAAIAGRFLRRLACLIARGGEVTVLREGGPPAPLPQAAPATAPAGPVSDPRCRTEDQARAVAALVKVCTGQRRRPVVLTSDRGRGKSAAFGIAAATLLERGLAHIVVTGPRPQAVEAVFEQAHRLLPQAQGGLGALQLGGARLEYRAADDLILNPCPADLVLVDEAAALPTPLLARLLMTYPRIAFATTVHGYEGTGRGFALRFHRILDGHSRGWKALRLHTPVRWAPGDPLERFAFRALLLDAEAAPAEAIAGARPENCRPERVDRDALVDDEQDLSQLFGLLVLAHYRTRPYDLRNLLDGPNLELLVLRHEGHVVGTALLALEGGFDAETALGVWAGWIRPRGHLLPESLAAHLGLREAPRLRMLRVMRIAVHPAVQGRGLGLKLLAEAEALARARGCDLLGTSFGATPELLRFWRRGGYVPVRLSARRDAASGEHSALMLRGLSPTGEALREAAAERFLRDFPLGLADPLARLEPEIADALLAAQQRAGRPSLPPGDWEDLAAFALGGRVYEATVGPAWRLAAAALADPDAAGRLTADARHALIVKVLQKRPWGEAAQVLGLSGRAQVVAALRSALRGLLAHYADAPLAALLQRLERGATDRNRV